MLVTRCTNVVVVVIGTNGGTTTTSVEARAASLVLPASPAHGHVAERPALRPIAPAVLAEVSRLRQAVVVVVAELGVHGVAARALDNGGTCSASSSASVLQSCTSRISS